ncbi:antibiotic biosynthesis monooxygenase [Cupriavidus sp. USMAA2-4]|uniref:antibiotic biosynthesis monooxygenase family protein n=1 Tax=Cupriavidus sp. USMAA2-4 TaxID=876364 RepID=UPI0008A706B0|nr:antibiotic biosynthesis monooxygenase [Cupriavidus sp. USMAA2-4]AOY91468.1 antibiotic biosynthesis monooxygenase [Cupriavidus sp. USMAA2-4]
MYSSTFIFRAGEFDDEFHRLDQQIAESARAIPGYLGEETWESPGKDLIQNVYYWESEEALLRLIRHPAHLEAKSKQARWLDGYRVVIAKVIREYGDGGISSQTLEPPQALKLPAQP